MATSLSYTFQNVVSDKIIKDAFVQIGIPSNLISGLQYKTAQDSLNFLLSSWMSQGAPESFMIQNQLLALNPGQNIYPLPSNVADIREAYLINADPVIFPSNTQFFNSTGANSQVFTQTLPTTYTENLTNTQGSYYVCMPIASNIVYPVISYVGITSAAACSYSISIQQLQMPSINSLVPFVGDLNWQTVLEIPQTFFYAGITQWFTLPFQITAPNISVNLNSFTANQVVSLQSIQICSFDRQIPLSQVRRDTFSYSYNNGESESQSSIYYFKKSNPPTVSLWPIPNDNYMFFSYNGVNYIQDVGNPTNQIAIDCKFIDALTVGLAARLARAYMPEKIEILDNLYNRDYIKASIADGSDLPIQITRKR